MEDGLSDVAEDAGLFGGDTLLDESMEDSGHDLHDVGGRGEVSGGSGELGGEGFIGGGKKLEARLPSRIGASRFGSVSETEAGVAGRDRMTAAASTGEEVGAAVLA